MKPRKCQAVVPGVVGINFTLGGGSRKMELLQAISNTCTSPVLRPAAS